MLNVLGHCLILAFGPFMFLAPGFIDVKAASLVIAIHLVTAALMIIGYFQVNYRPFVWAVVLASIVSLSRGFAIWESDYNIVVTVLSAIWAFLFWALVVPTARIRRLVEDNPDLTIAKRITGSSTRRSGKVSPKQALQLAERRAWRNAGVTIAIVTVVVVGSSFAFYKGNQVPNFDEAWAEFQTDWQSGNVDEVAAWFNDGSRGSQREELEAAKENRNWGTNWPSLSDHEKDVYESPVTAQPSGAKVEAVLSDGTAVLDWRATDSGWKLNSVELPDPDFDPVLNEWKRHWAGSNFDDLAGFFAVDKVEKMKRSLRSMAERRDWTTLPRITETKVEEYSDGYRRVYLHTEDGRVRVTFKVVLDRWTVSSIKPPPRD